MFSELFETKKDRGSTFASKTLFSQQIPLLSLGALPLCEALCSALYGPGATSIYGGRERNSVTRSSGPNAEILHPGEKTLKLGIPKTLQ